MAETGTVYCLDTNVFIKALVEEEPVELTRAAEALLIHAMLTGQLIAPAFAWTEVGSTLRNKVRQGIIDIEQANAEWTRFRGLPIEFADSPALRARAWEIAERRRLPNLYDAAFLACTETFLLSRELIREFWTADDILLRALSDDPPPFVRRLQAE